MPNAEQGFVGLDGFVLPSRPAPRAAGFLHILGAESDIYLGIINPPGSADNPIYLDNNTSTTTDHDGMSLPVIDETGDVVDGFSHLNLGRTYAAAVTVEEVAVGGGLIPEPAGLGLIGLAALSLRKKRT